MSHRLNLVFLSAVALLVILGFVRLGFWQLDRAQWKAEWLAQWQAAVGAPAHVITPVDVQSVALPDRQQVAHVQLPADVYWDPDAPLIALDNRIRDGRAGFVFYRLLVIPHLNVRLLVELGWQAWSADRQLPAAAALRKASAITDSFMVGLLLPWPSSGIDLGEAGSVDNEGRLLLSRLDRDVIAAGQAQSRLALANAVLRLDPWQASTAQTSQQPSTNFVRESVALPNTLPPERHRGYAFQWFAMAAAVALIYGVLMWKSSRQPRAKRAKQV